jgi:hypothetical protein
MTRTVNNERKNCNVIYVIVGQVSDCLILKLAKRQLIEVLVPAKLIMDDDERSDLEDLEENEPDWQREFRLSHSDDPSVMTAPLRERMPSLERLDLSQDSQGLDENLSAERPLTERLEFSMENPEYWLNPSVPSDVYKVVRDDDDNVSVASDSPQQIFQQLQQVQNRTENKTDSGM